MSFDSMKSNRVTEQGTSNALLKEGNKCGNNYFLEVVTIQELPRERVVL